jgi:hypothetical protein
VVREMQCSRGHVVQVAEADLGKAVRCPTCGAAVGPGALEMSTCILGRLLILSGLVLAMTSRGCDVLGFRGVARARAQASLAAGKLTDDDKMTSDDFRAGSSARRAFQKDDKTEADSRSDSKKKDDSEQKKVRDLRRAAERAESENVMDGYLREWLFVIGTVVLSLGLVIASWVAVGAERWVYLIMMALVTFSIFIGGFPWIAPMLRM